MRNTREELIQNIKDCGQSLIDNAENIVADCRVLTGLSITCFVDKRDYAPYISVNTDFIPEKFLERC
jgi:hypothetical protein